MDEIFRTWVCHLFVDTKQDNDCKICVEPYVPEKAGKENNEIVGDDQRGVRHNV